jgi:hypothetical protein
MVATFNGWDEMPELEREALDLWELETGNNEEMLGRSGPLDAKTPVVNRHRPGAQAYSV